MRDRQPSDCDILQEVRLAVVMYGGISLAIYIYGTAHELFKLVRATAYDDSNYKLAVPDKNLNSSEHVYRKLGQIVGTSIVKPLDRALGSLKKYDEELKRLGEELGLEGDSLTKFKNTIKDIELKEPLDDPGKVLGLEGDSLTKFNKNIEIIKIVKLKLELEDSLDDLEKAIGLEGLKKKIKAENSLVDRINLCLEPFSTVHTRFVIDILSGSSAGGINAIALAKGLVEKKDIKPLQKVWIKEGDISKLLDSKADKPKSLLNSGLMYGDILEGLQGMDYSIDHYSCDTNFVDELDLCVTATDVNGLKVRNCLPAVVSPLTIDEVQYRNVFRFQYKAKGSDHVNDFENNNPFLAFTARCTSAIPFVFEPMVWDNRAEERGKWQKACRQQDETAIVSVFDDKDKENFKKASKLSKDRKERLWREYVKVGVDPEKRAFSDGGVLDNKPFSYAIKTIEQRLANNRIDRKLIYIEPAPEDIPSGDRNIPIPNVLDNVKKALIDLPRHETIFEDLKNVEERNKTVKIVQDIFAVRDLVTQPGLFERNTISDFCGSTLGEAIDEKKDQTYGTYLILRVNIIKERLSELLQCTPDNITGWCSKTYGDNNSGDKIDKEARIPQFLYELDIEWRKRRLNYIQKKISHLLDPDPKNWEEQRDNEILPALKQMGREIDAKCFEDKRKDDFKMGLRAIKRDLMKEAENLYAFEKTRANWINKGGIQDLTRQSLGSSANSDEPFATWYNKCKYSSDGEIRRKFIDDIVKSKCDGVDKIDKEKTVKLITRILKSDDKIRRKFIDDIIKSKCDGVDKIDKEKTRILKSDDKILRKFISNFVESEFPNKDKIDKEKLVGFIEKYLEPHDEILLYFIHDFVDSNAIGVDEISKEELDKFSIDKLVVPKTKPNTNSDSNLLLDAIRIATHLKLRQISKKVREDILNPTQTNANADAQFLARTYLYYLYDNYELYDRFSYPILYATGINEIDQIQVHRFSPEDAISLINEKGKGEQETTKKRKKGDVCKLAGNNLFHFGAFLEKEWRKNDILWGKLDGAEQIITMMLPEAKELSRFLIQEAHLRILCEEAKQEDDSFFDKEYKDLVKILDSKEFDDWIANLQKKKGEGDKVQPNEGGQRDKDQPNESGQGDKDQQDKDDQSLAEKLESLKLANKLKIMAFMKKLNPNEIPTMEYGKRDKLLTEWCDLWRTVQKNRLTLKSLSRQEVLENLTKGTTIVGRIMETLADDLEEDQNQPNFPNNVSVIFKKVGAFLTRIIGRPAWGIVELATPGNRPTFKHWLSLFYVILIVMWGGGTLFGIAPAAKLSGILLLIMIVGQVLYYLLTWFIDNESTRWEWLKSKWQKITKKIKEFKGKGSKNWVMPILIILAIILVLLGFVELKLHAVDDFNKLLGTGETTGVVLNLIVWVLRIVFLAVLVWGITALFNLFPKSSE
ncbi:MAG: patatin-like protein [Anaerolineaceae bacterium]|nr:patatin-like protein [Anaerolineaceae bacterium]MCB9099215.1 patatin-like protein [Anaerolineales bacterium]